MRYGTTIVDDIGNEHPRRNLRLADMGVLEERLASEPKENVAEIRSELRSLARGNHDYEKSLADVRAEEKSFLAKAPERKKDFEKALTDSDDKIRTWNLGAMESAVRAEFYERHLELSYDFELLAKKHRMLAEQLPEIANKRRKTLDELHEVTGELERAKKRDQTQAVADFRQYRESRLKQRDEEKSHLKKLHKEGQISSKAFANEKRARDLAAAEDIRSKKQLLPLDMLTDRVRYLKHRLRHDEKQAMTVLHSDIADLRRKTPIEISKRFPWVSYLTIPIPGLGQLMLGQRIKSIFFFIGTLYAYLIAIPYALGRGNYRGQGVFGLVSLAEGASRLDRSVIFMIEGVIAIILLMIAFLIFYQSFRDVRKNEKRMIQGIRINNWFETRTAASRSGFPYFASAPSALITLFIVLLPIAVTVLISFTNYDPSHQSKFNWIGLANYKQIFLGQGIAGGPFWLITGWTLIWTLVATSLAIFIGFALALLVNQDRVYGKRFFRTIYLLPWAVPAFITIMFFSIMFSPDGPLTNLLQQLTGEIINVKNSPWGTRIVLILLQGWLGSSYVFLLCTGILQSIPGDLYEAANIDGATGFQQTRHITIPILLFQTAPLMIGQYTFNFNNFSIIYLFNGGGPFEPSKYGNLAGSSDLLISYIYKLTVQKQFQGIGAAITMIVSLVLIFFTWIGFSRSKSFKEEKL
ncbi:MAG: ABC transporter permease subunit [Saccharofermentanales bacterium]|jgi:arabinogalactan oligomer/maltooligosaccharide transport system permease protein